jgi:hypothetical protein
MHTKIHIVPHDGEWAIRLAGTEDPVATHPSQQAAIEAAMDLPGIPLDSSIKKPMPTSKITTP